MTIVTPGYRVDMRDLDTVPFIFLFGKPLSHARFYEICTEIHMRWETCIVATPDLSPEDICPDEFSGYFAQSKDPAYLNTYSWCTEHIDVALSRPHSCVMLNLPHDMVLPHEAMLLIGYLGGHMRCTGPKKRKSFPFACGGAWNAVAMQPIKYMIEHAYGSPFPFRSSIGATVDRVRDIIFPE